MLKEKERRERERGPSCILPSVLSEIHFSCLIFINLSTHVEILHQAGKVIVQASDMRHYSLLLHNFDPGYRYKIML